MLNRVLAMALTLLVIAGCSPAAKPGASTQDLTAGKIVVECSPEARPALARCIAAFEGLYPQAHLELRASSSRDAVAALFADRADMAVITREVVQEERSAAVRGKLDIDSYRFARDAAVILVNAANRVEHLTLEDVRRIYSGEARSWSEFGGSALSVEPVVQAPDADMTEFFIEEVLGGETIRAHSVGVTTGQDVVRSVRERPGAVGYVSLAESGIGTKAVQLAALKGLPYFTPDLERVHDGKYPVTRFYNMVVRAKSPALAGGFITYVTSLDGQRLIREAGLVPTTVPVRFVRRSAMLSTHTQGDTLHTP